MTESVISAAVKEQVEEEDEGERDDMASTVVDDPKRETCFRLLV
jgi:hypothetical protein